MLEMLKGCQLADVALLILTIDPCISLHGEVRKMDHKHDQTTPWKLFPFAGTVIRNLFSKPCTTGYPFEPAQYPERMRGHVEICVEDCISCGLCARSCPPGALQVDRAAGTWTINRFDCVQCGNCVQRLPQKVPCHCAGLHSACRTEGQRDLYPAQGTGCRAGGQGRRQAGERCRQVRLLHPLRQKMSPERHHGGPRFQDLETGRSGLRWLRACAPPPVPRNA